MGCLLGKLVLECVRLEYLDSELHSTPRQPRLGLGALGVDAVSQVAHARDVRAWRTHSGATPPWRQPTVQNTPGGRLTRPSRSFSLPRPQPRHHQVDRLPCYTRDRDASWRVSSHLAPATVSKHQQPGGTKKRPGTAPAHGRTARQCAPDNGYAVNTHIAHAPRRLGFSAALRRVRRPQLAS